MTISEARTRREQFRRLYRRGLWLRVSFVGAFILAVFLALQKDGPLGAQVTAWLVAVLFLAGWMWADILTGRTACPNCGYRVRSAGVHWKRCAHCAEQLT
jgi:hypothetical protein